MKICETGGCMAKLSGTQLRKILANTGNSDLLHFTDSTLIPNPNSDLLISTDFGPLVGKNCSDAGTISALNAISDIYVSGGIPLFASVIMIVGNDLNQLEQEELFLAVSDTCDKEGVKIIGGHTIVGVQTIVGLTVIGIKGEKTLSKDLCHNGDHILISKSVGTGISLRAYYDRVLSEEDYQEAITYMKQTNKLDDRLVSSPFLHAASDITGFGLVGTLSEMLHKDQGAILYLSKIPFLNSINKLSPFAYDSEYIRNNIRYTRSTQDIDWELDSIHKMALCDPQTNGPVIICVDSSIVDFCESINFTCIGRVTNKNGISLEI